MIRPGIWRRELAVPLQSIQAELNRLFDEYWHAPAAADGATVEARSADPSHATISDAAGWTPTIDLWDSPTELTLVVDLPGVVPGSIDLSLAGSVLTLRGEKEAPVPPATGAARGRIKERLAGSFHREITLMDEVDFDRVEAQSKDGVLTVRLPKREVGPPRTIPIRPAAG